MKILRKSCRDIRGFVVILVVACAVATGAPL